MSDTPMNMTAINTFAPLQVAAVENLLRSLGLGPIIDAIGVWPTVGIAIVSFIVVGIGVIGGRTALKRVREEASRADIASGLREEIEDEDDDMEVVQKVNQEDNDVLTEATRRLERRGKDINGENLTAVLKEIEEEESSDDNETTGLLDQPGDREQVARMAVSPEKVEEKEDHVIITTNSGNEFYARNVIISSYPDRVRYGWLDKLFSAGLETNGADVRVSYHIWPRDPDTMMDKLNKQATRLTSTIRRKQKEGKINTMEEEQQREKVNKLRDQLSKGSTRLFDFGLYVQVVAETEEKLDDGMEELNQFFGQSNARIAAIRDRQLDATKSNAPLGNDQLRQTQIMDMESLGTTFPFIEPTRMQPDGVLFGFHQTTNSPVIVDRFNLSGHNTLVTGKIGSGKSYLTKLLMWRRLMMDPDTELLIIDPVGGFGDTVEALDGQVIKVDKDTTINPLEIREAEQTVGDIEDDPYDMKIRSVMGMFQTHFSGERSLSKGEEGVLRRAIRFAYLQQGITKNPQTHSNPSPTIGDVIDILEHMSKGHSPNEFLDLDEDLSNYVGIVDDEDTMGSSQVESKEREAGFAHNVLLGLEEFTPGGQRSNLNGTSDIDMDARVVQFDLENVVDANNAGLFMHIMLDYLFQRAKSSSKRTLVTIDEAHYMLGEEGPLNILNTFARHSRHYTAGMTLVSQTVDEFMEGKAKEIYDQCDIRVLMRHEDIGKDAMESLGLTQPERDFVLSAQAGNTADHSECLLHTTDVGKRRLRVYSNEFEHHVIDEDAPSVWTYLYENGSIEWETIPDTKQDIVRRELRGTGNAPST